MGGGFTLFSDDDVGFTGEEKHFVGEDAEGDNGITAIEGGHELEDTFSGEAGAGFEFCENGLLGRGKVIALTLGDSSNGILGDFEDVGDIAKGIAFSEGEADGAVGVRFFLFEPVGGEGACETCLGKGMVEEFFGRKVFREFGDIFADFEEGMAADAWFNVAHVWEQTLLRIWNQVRLRCETLKAV